MELAAFFPVREKDARKAQLVCRACPVRRECLEHAVSIPEAFGVWGSMTAQERALAARSQGTEQRTG